MRADEELGLAVGQRADRVGVPDLERPELPVEAELHGAVDFHDGIADLADAGDLRRASLIALRIRPVEEPHDPFDEGAVGVSRGLREETAAMVVTGHPAVEVVAGTAGGEG